MPKLLDRNLHLSTVVTTCSIPGDEARAIVINGGARGRCKGEAISRKGPDITFPSIQACREPVGFRTGKFNHSMVMPP
jgi:hypothetical protein